MLKKSEEDKRLEEEKRQKGLIDYLDGYLKDSPQQVVIKIFGTWDYANRMPWDENEIVLAMNRRAYFISSLCMSGYWWRGRWATFNKKGLDV